MAEKHVPKAGKEAHAEHDAHGAAHAEHPPHKKHKPHEHDHGPGTPPWLISFGDMMTLFLCFFIMLVTMGKEQDAGLVASGLGPLVAALESSGMDNALDGAEVLYAVNTYRRRFGLAAITDPDNISGASEVKSASEVESIVKKSLRPYSELKQPFVADFREGSAELSDSARRYLDLLVDTLRPGFGQLLILEGHADDAGASFAKNDAWLAVARAQAVKDYMVKEHGLIPQRVEARAWAIDVHAPGISPRGVDARFIQPEKKAED